MRKFVLILFCIFSMQMMAQEEKFRVTFNVGDPMYFSVNDIKDINFVEDPNPLDIVGSEWFCEEVETYGTYESFEFREDGTLTYYPYYLYYHSGYMLPGVFNFEDYMLTMKIGGSMLHQAITNHSATSFVVTSAGMSSTYYKVQKAYNIKTTDAPISIGNEGDVVTFVDNEFISLEDNKIKPLKGGTGYALVKDLTLNAIVAYRINVESVKTTKDWTQYFKKTKEEITSEFGKPLMTEDDDDMETYIYYGNDPAFTYMFFCFDKDSGKMFMFQGAFVHDSERENYQNNLEKTFIKDENRSTETVNYYYDTDNRSTASVSIKIQSSPTMLINYMELNR